MKLKAKFVTLIMLIIGFVAGLVCLYIPSLDMAKYTEFVKAFAYLYTPLIASIGCSAVTDKIVAGKKENKCAEN